MNLAVLGALVCFLSVGFGAFGAHAVSAMLDTKAQGWWQTATEYLWYHGLGFLALGWTTSIPQIRRVVLWSLVPGILIFSGSLYLYAFTAWRPLGMITPIGGTLLLIGWLWLAITFRKQMGHSEN